MTSADKLYWVHALSPLHVGLGRGEGYIDLPLLREKVTGHPYVPGSSIKGVLADHYQATAGTRQADPLKGVAFGKADDGASPATANGANAGALVLTDARLACLPVRSLYGTFAWCTSRLSLQRLVRDLDAVQASPPAGVPPPPASCPDLTVVVPDAPASKLVSNNKVYLEDLDLPVQTCPATAAWARWIPENVFPGEADWQGLFKERFAVLPDTLFDFLCETGTEVQPHIKIHEELKRAEEGALWYEESLPTESILVGLVWCDPHLTKRMDDQNQSGKDKVLNAYCTSKLVLQIGGKATVGKGRCECVFARPAAPA
jgi:CRISPR-associated protein Cmr4